MTAAERQAAYEARNRAAGLCPCGQRRPKPGRVTCAVCMARANARQRAARARKRQAGPASKA
jgi:hypothetical protein